MRLFELTTPVPRRTIIDALQGFAKFMTTGNHTAEEIADQLQDDFDHAGIDVEVDYEMSPRVGEGQMNMNAWYDPKADEDGQTPVGITLLFSDQDTGTTSFDKGGVKMFLTRLADAVVHELIHADQHRKRGYMTRFDGKATSSDPRLAGSQEYLSRNDEIEAYAHNIASELLRSLDKETAMQYMRSFGRAAHVRDELGNLLSDNMFGILATFEFDTEHPVIKRLVSKVYKYLDILDNE